MEMLEKLATLSVLVVLVSATAVGMSFGSFTSTTEKTVNDLSATYKISVFNPGDKPLKIKLEGRDVDDDVTLRFNAPGSGFDSFTLEPSEVTENPSDDRDWFLLKDGSYVEVKEINVRAFMEKRREDDTASFKVDVKAIPQTSAEDYEGEKTSPSQSVVQVRSYSYTMNTEADRKPVKTSSGEEDKEKGSNGFGSGLVDSFNSGVQQIVTGMGGTPSTGDSTQEPDVRVQDTETESQEDKNPKPAPPSNSTEKTGAKTTGSFFSGVNPVTPMLLIGVLLSTVYLLKVV